jgi:hypothetical protein
MEIVIRSIEPEAILAGSRQILGLAEGNEQTIEDPLLAGLLRRSAGIFCPCSRATLTASVLECLQYLDKNEGEMSDRIEAGIEALIIGGDLLELRDVVTNDPAVKGTWLFAAPPGFVVRPSGDVFIFGIVHDQDSFLPQSLASRIRHDGYSRTISPRLSENLAAELREQGLQKLSEVAWLRAPKAEPPREMVDRIERQLAAGPIAGDISDLQILDSARPPSYYSGRWVAPKSQNGIFVARRPQEFGAPIWCVVLLEAGRVLRLADLPLEKTRWRGCDAAWHLQMAIDHCYGTPQKYNRRAEPDGIRLDFFSPLPQWAQRRLMIFGRPLPRENCLFSYLLAASESETEERFLQQRLWIVKNQEQK